MKALIHSLNKINFSNTHYTKLFIKKLSSNNSSIKKQVDNYDKDDFNNNAKDINYHRTPQLTPYTNYTETIPTPVTNPKIILFSKSLSNTLNIDYSSILSSSELLTTTSILSGNTIAEGSKTIAHCYCGYQFGNFAGQLGDGRAITLGDFYVNKNDSEQYELYELQLKGSGLTPYSRTADGRAVLRSSIREYLASEYLFEIGVPTTRALSLIVTDDKVARDPEYNRKVIYEKCAIVGRVASSFLRFGSFEIFVDEKESFSSSGPSAGLEKVMLGKMLEYLVEYHYKDIHKDFKVDNNDNDINSNNNNCSISQVVLEKVFEEITKRTALLVANWQVYGFVHGVLNTDNMSVLGLTIDYGPYGFLDYYDKFYISNSSDINGRYSFCQQPTMCEWNLIKFSQAWNYCLPRTISNTIIKKSYNKIFSKSYNLIMSKRLGFIFNSKEIEILINDLSSLLHEYGFDYAIFMNNLTNLYKELAITKTNENNDSKHNKNSYLPYSSSSSITNYIKEILSHSLNYETKIQKIKPLLNEDNLNTVKMIMEENPILLYQFGASPEFVEFQILKDKDYKEFNKNNINKEEYNLNKERKLKDFIDMWINRHNNEIKIIRTEAERYISDSSNTDANLFKILETKFNNSNTNSNEDNKSSSDTKDEDYFSSSSAFIEYLFKYKNNYGVSKPNLLNNLNKEYEFINKILINKINKSNDDIFDGISKLLVFKFNVMRSFNPIVGLRRHVIQNAIKNAEINNYDYLNTLDSILSNPFDCDSTYSNNDFLRDLVLKDLINPPNLNENKEVVLSCSS